MKFSRSYIARWDDGHDYGEFEFSSTHRANSKANLQDAKEAARSRYGLKRSRCMNITETYLSSDLYK